MHTTLYNIVLPQPRDPPLFLSKHGRMGRLRDGPWPSGPGGALPNDVSCRAGVLLGVLKVPPRMAPQWLKPSQFVQKERTSLSNLSKHNETSCRMGCVVVFISHHRFCRSLTSTEPISRSGSRCPPKAWQLPNSGGCVLESRGPHCVVLDVREGQVTVTICEKADVEFV